MFPIKKILHNKKKITGETRGKKTKGEVKINKSQPLPKNFPQKFGYNLRLYNKLNKTPKREI